MDNKKVLRASRIGSLCDRALFYSVNGAEEITSEKSQRIFEVGRVLEPLIISWLRSDGWNVQRNLFINSNEGMSFSISLNDGIIEAHPDCVIFREDSGLILADIKTMNDRSFRSLKREGTAKSHPQYADQLTIYAHALRERGHNIEQLAIVALNKNNCEGYIDFFQFEQQRYETLRERAERIFACEEAPEQGDRFQGWCCSYCGYSHLCELAKKDTAVGEESVPATNNQDVIDAVELLRWSFSVRAESLNVLEKSLLMRLKLFLISSSDSRVSDLYGAAISFSFSTRLRVLASILRLSRKLTRNLCKSS